MFGLKIEKKTFIPRTSTIILCVYCVANLDFFFNKIVLLSHWGNIAKSLQGILTGENDTESESPIGSIRSPLRFDQIGSLFSKPSRACPVNHKWKPITLLLSIFQSFSSFVYQFIFECIKRNWPCGVCEYLAKQRKSKSIELRRNRK